MAEDKYRDQTRDKDAEDWKKDDVAQRDYHDKSVQERMNRPTPEQQRTAGRAGGENIEGQTPVDRRQGQGAGNAPGEDEGGVSR